MTILAIFMFLGLFTYGGEAFGWVAYQGDVRLALFLSFILGIICGLRTRG